MSAKKINDEFYRNDKEKRISYVKFEFVYLD